MGRIVAIDYGKKRCGIAATDVLRIVPGALVTLAPAEVIDFLKDYLSREQVDRIIVGEALQDDGTPSDSMRYITPFVNRLRKCSLMCQWSSIASATPVYWHIKPF